MALATDEHLGNEELVYVATTAPTDASDPEDAAYSEVGMNTGQSIQSRATVTEIRNKQGSATKAGTETATMTVSVNTSYTGDDGQDALRTAHFTNPKPSVWILATSGAVGDRNVQITAQVTGYNDDAPLDAAATLSFELAINTITFGTNS